jgi:signal transduction histidine kinase
MILARPETTIMRDNRISADRDLLFDAISNLVDNAIKHGREGRIVIVSVEQKDSEAVLSISDDGPGIPPDEFRACLQALLSAGARKLWI